MRINKITPISTRQTVVSRSGRRVISQEQPLLGSRRKTKDSVAKHFPVSALLFQPSLASNGGRRLAMDKREGRYQRYSVNLS